MTIKNAAISLNEFYKIIHQLPESVLKTELEDHVHEMVASMLKSCLIRNQQRNFVLKVQQYHHKGNHFSVQWDNLFNTKDVLYG